MTAAHLITAITGFFDAAYRHGQKFLGGGISEVGGVSPSKGAWIKPWSVVYFCTLINLRLTNHRLQTTHESGVLAEILSE